MSEGAKWKSTRKTEQKAAKTSEKSTSQRGKGEEGADRVEEKKERETINFPSQAVTTTD